ncbi:MAG TPA: hypothetical protein VNG51_16875 [Ktedonobacteraceae bacterium]|nr:hypothetical protein [Ktedonobacteraceae bacterium]
MAQRVIYTNLPARTIGGASGDYSLICDITSNQWAEYAIDCVVNGDGGTGAVVVSANGKPSALDYTGISTNKMDVDAVLKGWPIRIPATSTMMINSSYERIPGSTGKLYIRIDAAASTSLFVVIRFRIAELQIIPGPSVEVHPDHEQQLNIARSETTTQRLAKMGIPVKAQEI